MRRLFVLLLLIGIVSCGGHQTPPLTISSITLHEATVGYPYAIQLQVTGGTTPYHWCMAPGSPALPLGLTLGDSGLLSGTPLAEAGGNDGVPEKWEFTVQVTDDNSPCP